MKDIDAFAEWTVGQWQHLCPGPFDDRDFCIVVAGQLGEIGEVCERLKKRVRDGVFDIATLRAELGDVVYYWARICRAVGLSPNAVLGGVPGRDIDRYDAWDLHHVGRYDPQEPGDLTRMMLFWGKTTGRLCEALEAWGRRPSQEHPKLSEALRGVFDGWCLFVRQFGLTPSDVLATNEAKLKSRRARGCLGGSGNDR